MFMCDHAEPEFDYDDKEAFYQVRLATQDTGRKPSMHMNMDGGTPQPAMNCMMLQLHLGIVTNHSPRDQQNSNK